ncbi:CST complex subunit CTC1 isoform X2 [Elaeis guineensis]|uniref:CST complex subunit CTC1 n=1 Tax=Elaeis guineensis var. tenera TaxID=51953 RepID=A0A6J0PCX9_ELAGV|nr:CST complex subunit CTC1 isoform X2 [Elaeis guineensis]
MEGVQILSVSDLLRVSRPLTGAASLRSSSSSSPPSKRSKLQSIQENPPDAPLLLSDPNPNPRIFSPLKRPVLLIGIIDLFREDVDHCCMSRNQCLSFSDGSSRICCSVLDLDLEIIGREVHVLAWNFVPFKDKKGGVLEVIRWSLPASEAALELAASLSIPSTSSSQDTNLISRSRAFGILRSISPVFSVPCAKQSRDQKNSPCGNLFDAGDSIGFLADVLTCSCELCCNSSSIADCHSSVKENTCHSFTKSMFVYFLTPTSWWRPVLCKLIGKLIIVSGLKKKLIFVGGKESYVMFVTTVKSVVSLPQFPMKVKPLIGRPMSPSGGVYKGVVTGVYMQGMAVELDGKVWLLVTDPQLAPQHCLRVGAVVSVQNFHWVHPKFSWTRMLLLGTCTRTSIDIESFSLSETRSQSQSLLGKLIDSLTFSARFWVLLLISCFKRKFAMIFSDKEILGSKNKEGLVQTYASNYLPSNAFQSQHGMFMNFCKHDQCPCRSESSLEPLKLAIPISNFISRCEAKWVMMLSQKQQVTEIVGRKHCLDHFICEGISNCCMIRRIISSEDLGFVLMGALKVSPSSGRLQLVDATGSVDVVIPDLLSNNIDQNIYEVKSYKLVLEGLPMQLDHWQYHFDEPLLCRNIFKHFSYKRTLNQLSVYVQFYLGDTTCLNVASHVPSFMVGSNNLKSSGTEMFHLLLVTHKFPANDNFQDEVMSDSSSLFADAFVFPYNLYFRETNEDSQLAEVMQDNQKSKSDFIDHQKDLTEEWSKQPRLVNSSSRIPLTASRNSCQDFERRLCNIPCSHSFTFRRSNLHGSLLPGYLCSGHSSAVQGLLANHPASRILLEFKSDSFSKYQLLRLGAYYILKCSNKGLLCYVEDCECLARGKVLVDSQTNLWSLSFSFDEIMQHEPAQDNSSGVSSVIVGGTTSFQNELLFLQSLDQIQGTSDVHLHLSVGSTEPMKNEMEAVKHALTRFLAMSGCILSVSSCVQIMMGELIRPSGITDPQSSKLLQGNQISLNGDIENVHMYDCKSGSCMSFQYVANGDRWRVCNICIHVNDDHQMVRIRGGISRCAYPVGMGPGANATFHRVLVTCTSSRRPELVLTPISFIVINSIKEVDCQHGKEVFLPSSRLSMLDENFLNTFSLSLISQMKQCVDSKLVRFRCRVVAIHFLVLESHPTGSARLQSGRQFKMPEVKIPLAGFVLDDGSSLSCCWADDCQAETLLRLHETSCQAFFCGHKFSGRAGNRNSQHTIGNQLERILKKNHRVIIRNYGAVPDLSCSDLTFSFDSDNIFSNSEERLLRFIILNACCGSILNVLGNKLDSDSLKQLDSELLESQASIQSLQNVWVKEVWDVNPLNEARNLLL